MEVLKPKALEMNFQMVGIRNFRIQGRITHSNFALEPNSIALNISAAVHPFYPDNSTTCQLDYSHYYDYNSYEISSRHNCNLSVTSSYLSSSQ